MNEGFIPFIFTLGAGVIGGLILNIMPCVLPGLFMKARSVLMQLQSGQELKDQRADGLAYLLGSLSTFTVYGLVIIILRASGQSLGWGMQMQSPIFVGALLLMTFLFALSCFDLFEINLGVNYSSSTYGPRLKSFVDGVFITLISTPCSAPILGGAVTVALASESAWWTTLLLFWSISIGLCLPILAISFFPSASKWVPRAGDWTESFKYFVGVTLLGACVWLYTVYIQLIPSEFRDLALYIAALITTLFLVFRRKSLNRSLRSTSFIILPLFAVALLYTVYQDFVPKDQAPKALYTMCLMAGMYVLAKSWAKSAPYKKYILNLMGIGLIVVSLFWASQAPVHHLKWVAYDQAKLTAHLERGKPVFLDFTADWCISCKTFEGLYLNTPSMAELFERAELLPLQADLTTPESPLWGLLKEFKRDGIPAYVLYYPNGEVELLPEGPPLSLHDRILAIEDKRNQ
jgi:thiol:disulfide interchange protein